MTKLPEPNFIERNPDYITKEWIELYEQKSGNTNSDLCVGFVSIQFFTKFG